MKWQCRGAPNLSSNYPQAFIRLEQLKRTFEKNARFRQQYTEVLEGYICKGHARKVEWTDSNVQFFLPHHGVFHPQKPNKLRVVFDCAAKFHGRSLNDELLFGPALMNNLVGVLFPFSRGKGCLCLWYWIYVSPHSHADFRSTVPRVPLVAKRRCVPQAGSLLDDSPPFRSQVVSELCEFCATSNRRRQFKRIWRLDNRDGEKEFLHGWLFESSTFRWRSDKVSAASVKTVGTRRVPSR